MKTIALIDPCWQGHHSTYLFRFSRALLDLSCRVVVLCPEPTQLELWLRGRDASLGERLRAYPYRLSPELPRRSSRLGRRASALEQVVVLAALLAAIERATQERIELVFFAFLDTFIGRLLSRSAFERRLGRPFSGLYFHPVHLRLGVSYPWLRHGPLDLEAVLRSHCCRSLAVLDEGIADRLSKRLRGKPVVCFPDSADQECSPSPSELENSVRRQAGGRKIIGLIGSLEKRKNLTQFLRHATQMEDYLFLLAGELALETFDSGERRYIQSILQAPPHNLFLRLGFMENEVLFNDLVRCCDLLYAVYECFPHSSNVLAKAASFRVPVVVSDRYLMGHRVRRFNLGFAIREDAPADFSGLVASGQPWALRSTPQFEQGCLAYLAEHSYECLVDAFKRLLAPYGWDAALQGECGPCVE